MLGFPQVCYCSPLRRCRQTASAVEAGIEVVEQLAETTDVFGTGDMGIANTTPSTAIVAALTGLPAADLTGRGTGISDDQLVRKTAVIDGFISTAGALLAQVLCPTAAEYIIAAQRSAEPGHSAMHTHLGKQPLLDPGLRLGEGTGAALPMPLLDAAERILTQVATFDEAHVSKEQP